MYVHMCAYECVSICAGVGKKGRERERGRGENEIKQKRLLIASSVSVT